MVETDKIVDSMTLLDLSDLKTPVAVVYDHPADYPDSFVARVWDWGKNMPTNALIKRETLQEIRDDIQAAGFWAHILRFPEDAPIIVESWI